MTPSLTASIWWPPRPMRCRPLATDGGASICTTRSIAPMSMPSSSDEVATSARSAPAFSRSSISTRCGARDRAVVRAHQRLAGELVERAGQPLGEPAAVDEDQRRPVRANQLEQPRMDRRPDRRPRIADRRRAARDVVRGRQPGHVLDRHFDRQLQRLLRAGVDDGDRAVADGAAVRREFVVDLAVDRRLVELARRCRLRPRLGDCRARRLSADDSRPAQKPRHLVERPLGRRQADALRRLLAARREPLERQREVRAALGRHQRVDLVDDDRVDAAQRLAGVRGQQQVERFGRRDQDVGRLALKARALGLRRVAGADRDRRRRRRCRRVASATRAMPASGARRLRSTSTASALSGET